MAKYACCGGIFTAKSDIVHSGSGSCVPGRRSSTVHLCREMGRTPPHGAEDQGELPSCPGQRPLGPKGQPSVQMSVSLAVWGCSVVSPYWAFLSVIVHYLAEALHSLQSTVDEPRAEVRWTAVEGLSRPFQ